MTTKEQDKRMVDMLEDNEYFNQIEMIKANDLYKEYMGMSNIERVGEEGFVVRKLMNGWSKNKIIKKLKERNPKADVSFNHYDMEKFILRHDEIVKYLEDETFASAKRHLKAQADVEEMLASLAFFTQKVVKEMRDEGDNSNLVSAIRALNKTIKNYSDVSGLKDKEKSPDTVVSIYSDKYEELKEKANQADFSVDFEELEDDQTDSRKEEKHSNREGDS